jgi:hypothetical protein
MRFPNLAQQGNGGLDPGKVGTAVPAPAPPLGRILGCVSASEKTPGDWPIGDQRHAKLAAQGQQAISFDAAL